MKQKKTNLHTASRTAVMMLIFLTLAGCNNAPSAMDPRGPAAAAIADLWWWLLGMGGAVYVVVMAYMLVALYRRRRDRRVRHGVLEAGRDDHAEIPSMDEPFVTRSSMEKGERVVLWAGIVAPTVILAIVFGMTVATLNVLATPQTVDRYTVQIVGRQWWWEVRYPNAGVITANEIHIPAGQPVRVVLSSDDVIHSLWVPELHGKLDLVPGMTNEFWLEADQPGIYRGLCAEFCGVQHAKMGFMVVAQPLDDFEAWLAAQSQPAAEPTDSLAVRGQQVFMSSTCINCHTIAGTEATGVLGPDLTHLASRQTLGAATVPNTRGNLGGWIANPQHIKPGVFMPGTPLTGDELQALIEYLTTLH